LPINEVQSPRQRYRILDYERLATVLQMRDIWQVRESCKSWVEEALAAKNWSRDNRWTESIAVGGKRFMEATKNRLGIRAIRRKVGGANGTYQLRESAVPYMNNSEPENSLLRLENTYPWDDIL